MNISEWQRNYRDNVGDDGVIQSINEQASQGAGKEQKPLCRNVSTVGVTVGFSLVWFTTNFEAGNLTDLLFFLL